MIQGLTKYAFYVSKEIQPTLSNFSSDLQAHPLNTQDFSEETHKFNQIKQTF